jgi:hypothetical protein
MALKFASGINETDLFEIEKFDELRAELRSEKRGATSDTFLLMHGPVDLARGLVRNANR